jgi:putative ABC transport system permease protein
MGKPFLICRLATRDLRRRRVEAALMLLAITAATTTLTMGLALYGVTDNPYQRTRAATRGPDVVASYLDLPPMPRGAGPAAGLAALGALAGVRGVTGHVGPYPIAWPTMRAGGITIGALAEGRDQAPASVDQPKLTEGSWVRPGAVVVERSFASALGVHAGSRITLDRRPFLVAGIAITAANASYPNADFATFGSPFPTPDCGMIWLTIPDARSLATRALPLSYVEFLRLAHPARAEEFVQAHGAGVLALSSWRDISEQDAKIVQNEQRTLVVGSWLLALLALASVAVLVGGQMTAQIRRVGLLKAVGAAPRLVAAVLLAEHLALAFAAAAAGLGLGWLAAPLLASPGAGLVGSPGAPSLGWHTAGLVTLVALGLALLATLVPAIRAAHVSTVAALADAARPARRRAVLVVASRWLPVPLLLGLRVIARRPRRAAATVASVAVTVTLIVAVLTVQAHAAAVQQASGGFSVLPNPRYESVDRVLLVISVVMITLAAVNAIFVTWATALDARKSSALARALGATPGQVSMGLSVAQVAPTLPGVALGVPAGIGLVAAVGHGQTLTVPSVGWLVLVVVAVPLVIAGLTAIPARIAARRSAAEILQGELA